jgi:hypothetical protein
MADRWFSYHVHDPAIETAHRRVLTIHSIGTESSTDAGLKAIYPDVYFEEQPDGRVLIFRSEPEAKDENNAIGSVEPYEG